jgi:hypothetical protein
MFCSRYHRADLSFLEVCGNLDEGSYPRSPTQSCIPDLFAPLHEAMDEGQGVSLRYLMSFRPRTAFTTNAYTARLNDGLAGGLHVEVDHSHEVTAAGHPSQQPALRTAQTQWRHTCCSAGRQSSKASMLAFMLSD